MMTHQDSAPFLQPVNTDDCPDYLRIIDTPMDLNNIRAKLLNGDYYSLDQFDSDCKLVFANSKSYNTNKRSRIFGMTLRLSSLYDAKIKEIKAEFKSAMKYNVRMTSRYGRKIKLRSNGRISQPLAEISTFIGHDSDDARHGFDEDMNELGRRGVVQPSTSGYLTRSASNRKLATTQTSQNHEQPTKKSSYSQNISDSEENSHMSASNSRSTRIQTRSKRSNGATINSSTSITAPTSFSGRINGHLNSSNDVSHNLNSNGGSNHDDSNQTLSDIENQNTSDYTVGSLLKKTRLKKSNTTANGKRDEASTSSKPRTSKRSRKQFSYKEDSSDGEENELDDSNTKKSTSTRQNNKVARKKRRVLLSDDENFVDDNSNEASNDAYQESNSNPSGQKLSRSGRPLRSVTQTNFL
jgi:bromodomain and WD repeat domain containing protein 1/3